MAETYTNIGHYYQRFSSHTQIAAQGIYQVHLTGIISLLHRDWFINEELYIFDQSSRNVFVPHDRGFSRNSFDDWMMMNQPLITNNSHDYELVPSPTEYYVIIKNMASTRRNYAAVKHAELIISIYIYVISERCTKETCSEFGQHQNKLADKFPLKSRDCI